MTELADGPPLTVSQRLALLEQHVTELEARVAAVEAADGPSTPDQGGLADG